MNIEILSRETIKPSIPTNDVRKTWKISLLDQFSPALYVPVLFFYNSKLSNPIISSPVLDLLKKSLSETLTIYYPLAEAQTNWSLEKFLEKPDLTFLNNFLPCNGNCLEKSGSSQTLAAFQTTKFRCGGIVIGACILHKVVDAVSISGFMSSWAKITGGSRDQVIYPDFSTVSTIFPPRNSMPNDFLMNFENFYFKGSKFNKMKRYVFDNKSIKALQAKSSSQMVPNPTRIEALTAFICKHVMKSYRTGKSKVLMVTHAVNLRHRLEQMLKSNSFGNIIWLAYGFNDAKENKIDLTDVAEMTREMFDSLRTENLEGIDSNDMFDALSEVLGSLSKINEQLKILRFTSWCNLGFYKVDFGWGTPIWVAYMGDMVGFPSKQHFLLLESGQKSEMELWMSCEEEDMHNLENDEEFLEFAVPNPRICLH
ncbi:hypothetical protein LIER_33193 [Lithospermum erythrorhizon]|uniref:Uncharacterized protein n=1 Tax=Lithospermum erythrorhizon TaxID=34254 RepID=A0AAV3RYI1_LITER